MDRRSHAETVQLWVFKISLGFPLQLCLFLGLSRVKVKEGPANFPVSGFCAADLTADFPLRSKSAVVQAHSQHLL